MVADWSASPMPSCSSYDLCDGELGRGGGGGAGMPGIAVHSQYQRVKYFIVISLASLCACNVSRNVCLCS